MVMVRSVAAQRKLPELTYGAVLVKEKKRLVKLPI